MAMEMAIGKAALDALAPKKKEDSGGGDPAQDAIKALQDANNKEQGMPSIPGMTQS
jgi:hypothetical protein